MMNALRLKSQKEFNQDQKYVLKIRVIYKQEKVKEEIYLLKSVLGLIPYGK